MFWPLIPRGLTRAGNTLPSAGQSVAKEMSYRLVQEHLTVVFFPSIFTTDISGGMALQRTYVSGRQRSICRFIKTIHFRLVFDGG